MVKNQEVDMFIVSHLPFPPIFTARLKMSADFNTFAIIQAEFFKKSGFRNRSLEDAHDECLRNFNVAEITDDM